MERDAMVIPIHCLIKCDTSFERNRELMHRAFEPAARKLFSECLKTLRQRQSRPRETGHLAREICGIPRAQSLARSIHIGSIRHPDILSSCGAQNAASWRNMFKSGIKSASA
jgi:hypothetical protein